METFGLLLGASCSILPLILGSLLVINICRKNKCSWLKTAFIVFLVWAPFIAAIAAFAGIAAEANIFFIVALAWLPVVVAMAFRVNAASSAEPREKQGLD